MGSYLFRRLLNLIPILIGISFLSFVLINLSPSDPAEVAVRVNEVTPTEEVLAETRAKLGLDKPFLTRYVAWLNNSLHGDFGNRYVDDKPVLGEIQKALPATLVLAGAALCLTRAAKSGRDPQVFPPRARQSRQARRCLKSRSFPRWSQPLHFAAAADSG